MSGGGGSGGRAALAAGLLGLACLVATWIFTNPPGSAPDEAPHYLRALGLSQGQWLGGALVGHPYSNSGNAAFVRQEETAARSVLVPAGMAPSGWACNSSQPNQTIACLNQATPNAQPYLEDTTAGTYPPWLYLPAALAIRLAPPQAQVALAAGRAATALFGLLLLLLAGLTLRSAGRPDLAASGLLLALSPMVVFLLTELGPNGLEVVGAICFWSAIAALWDEWPRPGATTWVALVAGGLTATLAREVGVAWLLSGALAGAVLVGGRRLDALTPRSRRTLIAVSLALLAGGALSVGWAVALHPQVPSGLHVWRAAVPAALAHLPAVFPGQVGVFGFLDVALPWPVVAAWGAMLAILVTLAFLVGGRRERAVLALLIVGAFVVPVGLGTVALEPFGAAVQGRYVLPFTVAVPILAGRVLAARSDRLGEATPRRLLAYLTAAAAAIQLLALYVNAHRYEVGVDGRKWFLPVAVWTPAGGWWLWFGVAILGALLAVAAAGRLSAGYGSRSKIWPDELTTQGRP